MKNGIIKTDPVTGRGFVGRYEVVDLGLPSGLLWATCNLEATKETSIGYYYQWGAGEDTYEYEDQYYIGKPDSNNTLPSGADTATQVMGKRWRMPTYAEIKELIDNTNYSRATIDGTKGVKFIHKNNSNAYVFFPVSGYYYNTGTLYEDTYCYVWSSTAYPNGTGAAFDLTYYYSKSSSGKPVVGYNNRFLGIPVRGVILGSVK